MPKTEIATLTGKKILIQKIKSTSRKDKKILFDDEFWFNLKITNIRGVWGELGDFYIQIESETLNGENKVDLKD